MTNTYWLEAWSFVARWLLQVKYALSHTISLGRVKIIKKYDNNAATGNEILWQCFMYNILYYHDNRIKLFFCVSTKLLYWYKWYEYSVVPLPLVWYVCVHKVRYTVYCCYCFRIIITNFRNDFFCVRACMWRSTGMKTDDEDLSSSSNIRSNLKRSDDIHEHNNSIKNRYENSHALHSHSFYNSAFKMFKKN